VKTKLQLLDIEHQLLCLDEEFNDLGGESTNVLDLLGIKSNERRLTQFLCWLLDPRESHEVQGAFADEFLDYATIENIDIKSIESFFTINRGSGSENTEIDIVIIGRDVCIGVEIKTTHQDSVGKLNKEYKALKSSFSSVEHHELLYLTYRPDDSPPPNVDYTTIFWSQLIESFKKHVAAIPSSYEKRLINDYIKTIQTHVMTEFDGISDRTELYLKYADAVDSARSAYEDDRESILDALATEFFSTKRIDDSWKRSDTRSGTYIKLYKPDWHPLENSVNMEFEPHPKLKLSGSGPDVLDEPYICIRFDVEGRDAQAVRDSMLDHLGQEGKSELESAGFTWFSKDESTYKFISKPVPLSKSSDDYDPIRASNNCMQQLWDIIEESVDAVAEEY